MNKVWEFTISPSKFIRCFTAVIQNAEELIKLRDSGATQEEMISVVTESTGLPKETVEQELAKFDPYSLS